MPSLTKTWGTLDCGHMGCGNGERRAAHSRTSFALSICSLEQRGSIFEKQIAAARAACLDTEDEVERPHCRLGRVIDAPVRITCPIELT